MRGLVLTGNPGPIGMLPPGTLSGGLVLTGQHMMSPGFSGPCPSPSKQAKNGGCCLAPAQSKSGKQQCCGPKKKTRVIKDGTKFKLACGPLTGPGPGPGPTAGNATIRSVSGNTITLSKAIGPLNSAGGCPAGKPNLEMRREAAGLGEYVATVEARQGTSYRVNFSAVSSGRVAPKVGEEVYLYCANGDAGGGGDILEAGMLGGLGEGFSTITSSSLFLPALLLIGGLIAYKAMSRASGPAPRMRR